MLSVFAFRLFTLGSLILLASCSEQSSSTLKFSGFTMGTGYHISIVSPVSKAKSEDVQKRVDERLESLNQQMSTYISDSDLSLLNKAAVGEAVSVSPELFHVLLLSMEASWLTSGAFDITVAPLVDLWGFGSSDQVLEAGQVLVNAPIAEPMLPSPDAIAKHLKNVGFQHIELNIGSVEITKTQAIEIDLSAIAKGYGVDQVAALLQGMGYQDFMVEVGGEIRTMGQSPRGENWRIAIEQPDSRLGAIHRALSLTNQAVATSGDYRNYFEKDGKRYSHTISPVTGYPISHNLASVTVVSDTAAMADALATGINVMGAEKGLLLAKQQGLAIYLIVKAENGFEAKYSDAFKPFLD